MATLLSLLGLLSAFSSYFFKKKWQYLIAQGTSIALIALSNLLLGLFYACVASGVALLRMATYYYLERKNKAPTFITKTFFASLVVLSYLITNILILHEYNPWDIMLMVINCSFVYVVAIRNLKLLRICMLPPIAFSILYCLIVKTTIFTTLSYAFEFVAIIFAMFYHKRKLY